MNSVCALRDETLPKMLFDWALIVLSSLIGAVKLMNIFIPRGTLTFVAIIVLALIGVAIQAGMFWSEKLKT